MVAGAGADTWAGNDLVSLDADGEADAAKADSAAKAKGAKEAKGGAQSPTAML